MSYGKKIENLLTEISKATGEKYDAIYSQYYKKCMVYVVGQGSEEFLESAVLTRSLERMSGKELLAYLQGAHDVIRKLINNQ